MGLTRCVVISLVVAACGNVAPMQMQSDAPVEPTGCTTEADCGSTTPYCDPVSSTCVACRFSSHCTGGNVCDNNVCRAPKSCKEIHTELPGLPNGVYHVDVDGNAPLAATDVFCEMTVDGGGWTLIQRTRWSWAASQALSTNYDTWHDTTIGTPGVGLAFRLAGQYWPKVAADGDMLLAESVRTTSGSACNPLYYKGTGAQIVIDKTAKTTQINNLTQSAAIINSPNLSTTDSGPDSALCVNQSNAVPWFYAACCSTCATYKGGYWNDEPHPMEAYTQTTADFFGHTEPDVCGAMAVRISDNASTHRGVDTMEMFLR